MLPLLGPGTIDLAKILKSAQSGQKKKKKKEPDLHLQLPKLFLIQSRV